LTPARRSSLAEDLGFDILCLPTGQGLVVKGPTSSGVGLTR
jgi:hypothetical protein